MINTRRMLGYKANTLMCSGTGTTKIMNMPSVPNRKLMFLSVPIFKHIRVAKVGH